MNEIESIKQAIAALEAQRPVLGDAVADTALAPLREKLASLQARPDAEQRKLVTILFADLVGFTAMSEHMDPEDIREIVNSYFARWTTSIEKYGGVVEKFIGDAVMAVFGLSMSREDDPENAVRAALEMRDALAELNDEFDKSWGLRLAMRVGIHTGTVMVSTLGERKDRDFVVVGDTVNLASRLQSVAGSGAILISHDTYRHVRGGFEIQMLSPVHVKGKAEPIQVYQVIQAKLRSFRAPTRGVEGIETRMVGRDSELAQLKKALLSVMETRKTQVVTVMGDAGLGKSRLIAEFDDWMNLLPHDMSLFKGRAGPSMQNLPYSLLRDLFSFRLQIYDSDTPQVVQEKIECGIANVECGEAGEAPAAGTGSADRRVPSEMQMRAHFIGHLLGFRFEDSPYLRGAFQDPQLFRDRALTYLIEYFKALASVGPVVMLLEDIHWTDDSSLEILERILDDLAGEPLLVVCTARPILFESHPQWSREKLEGRSAFTTIYLEPLSQESSHLLVEEILQKVEAIPEHLRELIASRAEGNPFFIEELIKMLMEEQVIINEDERWRIDLSHLAGVRIPSTLVEVLQARVDSVSPEERALLQRASVLGRVFWDDALNFMETHQGDLMRIGPQMGQILRGLNSREMVFTHRVSIFEGTREFYFIHALLRDVTYESVLKRLRKIYHGHAAAWLEDITRRSRRSGEQAVLIAEHYDRADARDKARSWYQRAGYQAADNYANAEAIYCLTRCIELWPEEDRTGKFEVLLRRLKIYDTQANRPEQKRDLETLQSLAKTIDALEAAGDQPQVSRLAQVSLQWWHFYDALGELAASSAAAQQAIAFARESGDKEDEAHGNLLLGAGAWRHQDYAAAQEYLGKALALARVIRSRAIEADCLRNLGVVLQYQGSYREARTHYEEAMRIYHEMGSEKGESMTLNSLGTLIMEQGLYREALPYLERSLELKRKIGHRRAEHVTVQNLGIVAEKLGDFAGALAYLEQVQRFSAETGDVDGEAEALNGIGSVATLVGDLARAKTCLDRALTLAREIGQKEYECEALSSLALLSLCQGDDRLAYQYSQDALALTGETDAPAQKAAVLTYAGHALLGLGQTEEAEKMYRAALELAPQMANARPATEMRAGLAMVWLSQGRHARALAAVQEILATLAVEGEGSPDAPLRIGYGQVEGLKEPFRLLLSCYRVLQATRDGRAGPLLDAAYRLLEEQANRLGDESLKLSFLENLPANREIVKEWELGLHSTSIKTES